MVRLWPIPTQVGGPAVCTENMCCYLNLPVIYSSQVGNVDGSPSPEDVREPGVVGCTSWDGATCVSGAPLVVPISSPIGFRLFSGCPTWSSEYVLASLQVEFLPSISFSHCYPRLNVYLLAGLQKVYLWQFWSGWKALLSFARLAGSLPLSGALACQCASILFYDRGWVYSMEMVRMASLGSPALQLLYRFAWEVFDILGTGGFSSTILWHALVGSFGFC